MPHSGGGGSHSGGGHHGGGHHSGGSGSSGSSSRVSSTPFTGCHTYAIYDRHGHSRLVYASSSNYHAEMTKKDLIFSTIFGSVFMLPGIIEFIVLVVTLLSCIYTGVKKTDIPGYVDQSVYIYDSFDLVTAEEEAALSAYLADFRDKTGIIPAVEFTTDDYWMMDYLDMENFAYNEYVCNFLDENHLLIVYSYGEENSATGFNEFHWESMWGDDLGRTANSRDEDALADYMQDTLTRANGKDVPAAILEAFNLFYIRLSQPGFKVTSDKIFLCMFMLIHGGIFFTVGLIVVLSSRKKYKASCDKGEKTYKIQGTPEVLKCEYCGNNYYKGTIGTCPACAAPLK